MMGNGLCGAHSKQYEMFCFEPGCKAEEEPMCSVCMCEHIKARHVKGATHIASIIKEKLVKVEKAREITGQQQDQIKAYHTSAEECLKIKDTVKALLEDKLAKLLALYTEQKEMATDNKKGSLSAMRP